MHESWVEWLAGQLFAKIAKQILGYMGINRKPFSHPESPVLFFYPPLHGNMHLRRDPFRQVLLEIMNRAH